MLRPGNPGILDLVSPARPSPSEDSPLEPRSHHETLPGEVRVLRWPHAWPLPEEEIIRYFEARGITPARWSNGPGESYSVHRHAYRKTLFCVRGGLTFFLPDLGRDVQLGAGDRLILPAGISHSAVVGPDGVDCVEAGETG